MILGVDLRSLPPDGTPGAGIAHAARGVWQALAEEAGRFDIEMVGYAPTGAMISGETKIVRLTGASGGALRRALKEHPCDALFVAHGAVPLGIRVPTFPWAHDLAIFKHPEWFPESWMRRATTTRLFLRGLRRAKHVFAVSEETREEVIRIGKITKEHVTVTWEGVEMSDEESVTDRAEPFVLIFGTVEPRKNIPFITELWPDVQKRLGRNVTLVVAGKDGWGGVLVEEKNNVLRRTMVSGAEHEKLLSGAAIVLVPSLYEGFGRTAVEAMTRKRAVIVSDRGSLPEVVGRGAIVLPLERERWVEAIVELLRNPEKRRLLGEAGAERAPFFSWKRVADTILAKVRETC